MEYKWAHGALCYTATYCWSIPTSQWLGVLATWAQCWLGNPMLHAEFTLGLKASAWSTAMKANHAQFCNNDLQLVITSMAPSCNGKDSRGAQEACQFKNMGANSIRKTRFCLRLADVAMRQLQCHLFLSAWYHSYKLAGQALNMKVPLSGTRILAPETGLEIDAESGPHGAVTHSA